MRNQERRTDQTLSGLLDVTQGQPPADRLPQIRSEYKARYREYATLTSRYLAFDLDSPPFTDQDMRRAVSFALDLRTLSRLENGFLAATCNAIPPQVPGYVAFDPCPYGTREGDSDLVRAEQLARGSGERETRVLVDGGTGPRAGPLAAMGWRRCARSASGPAWPAPRANAAARRCGSARSLRGCRCPPRT